ncbi:chloride channel protein [Tunturiibacter gelidoferens]|uniref:CIC family chloride channel protein n=1 Tax=Tunturiibacter gelidiferens TaxID=3069689 RepID=A0A9X0QDE4_9BACT|nr:chloride channel protein [Edaphobacter lichenicola]MBB5328308.1 CIC family chloride channel protein [Edaphobacter lichenicola]
METNPTIVETEPVAASTPREDMIARIAPGREERVFLVLSIFIGVISGLLVVSFRMAIEWLSVLLLGSSPNPHQPRLLYIPAAAGLVIALFTRYVFPNVRGSGINQTKAALYINNGYISFRTVIGKFLLSALAIGSGHSLGPEDPSLQIGAGVASLISRRFGMSKERLRIFAPIGAAAGLAAAFNAPISAILFVIEEVIGQWSAAVLGSIVLSAVASVVVARSFWGTQPMFRIPVVDLRDSRELLAYAALGVVGGFASLLFARCLSYLRPKLRSQPQWSQLLQPAAAGLLVGAIGYFGLVQVMGAGYEAIDQAMHAQFAWKMLLLLALFKIIATTLSFSSGTPGGMFAPTLFIGAMLGAAVGTFEKIYFPHLTGTIGSYALVGMGVLFAAFLRAPLTSVFMVLEVSGNYSIVLPVILANAIAYLISRTLQPVPILEQFTHQDGLDLPSMEELREESNLHLEDAMQPVTVPVLQGSETIADTLLSLAQYEDLKSIPVILVHCLDGLWYAAKREELEALGEMIDNAASQIEPNSEKVLGESATLAEHLGPERTPILFPDLPLSSALPHFQRWPLLPITNRAMRGSLEGTITLQEVLNRYQKHNQH